MSMTVSFRVFQKLVDEDLAWLRGMPATLERQHIIKLLESYRDDNAHYKIEASKRERILTPGDELVVRGSLDADA